MSTSTGGNSTEVTPKPRGRVKTHPHETLESDPIMNPANEATPSQDNAIPAQIVGAQEQLVKIARDVQSTITTAFRENPMLLPATTGAVGFLAGVLVSSKLTRILLVMGAGAAVTEFLKADGLGKLKSMVDDYANA